jgi:hypothetical protein
LERFLLECGLRPRLHLFCQCKQFPRVVARRIRLGRRRTELDHRVEHALEQVFRGHERLRPGERAQAILREQLHCTSPTLRCKLLRMAHVGGGKNLGWLAFLDAFAQETGSTIGGGHLCTS